MVDFSATWKSLVADLERERDELRLKAKLGKAEARDLLSAAEKKLEELRQRAMTAKSAAAGAVKDTAVDTEGRMKAIAAEIRASFGRIRKIL